MSKEKKDIVFEKIIDETLDQLIGEKFGNYSKYIIQERALPDLRDGLKPVQRRVLYAMYDLKLSHKTPYKKSARVVGDVIGKYHPHGDTSVYDAMVRLAQEWKVNMPLVDMHGNKGSIDGDSPAAMRYTEAKLAKISSELLLDIEKNLVSFAPNFDDSELEPIVLPARYPNLLLNGSTGIASGYSTNIPPHNLKELIKALIFILKNDSITLSNITKFIKGPDFPTGGIVSSSNSIKDAYRDGRGKITISSKWEYLKGKNEIHVTEIPYETNKSDIVKKIDDLIRSNKIPSLKEIRDDTDRTGLQITLICKPNVNVDLIMNYLFKSTDLRKNYSFNMVAIKDKKPELLSLIDILTSFSEFQIQIYSKLYNFELKKLEKRLEIVNGLIRVVDIIDEIIIIIKNSKNKSDARKNIIKEFNFNENQAEAIVTLRLYRLTSTDVSELKKELEYLNKLILHYKKGLNDSEYLKEKVIQELEKISKEFSIPRKTKIKDEIVEVKINEKDLVQEETVWVSVTHQGYIKKISQKSKELSNETTFGKREDDIVISMNETSNLKNLILFSAKGKYFSIPVYKISDSKFKDIGEHVSKYLSLDPLDKIISIALVDTFDKEGELLITTNQGMIKKSLIKDMNINQTKRGSKFINLKIENDEVSSILLIDNDESFITTITRNGYCLRYNLENITTTNIISSGIKNISLMSDDYVVATTINSIENVKNLNSEIIILNQNGKGKRMKVNDINLSSRGTAGNLIAPKPRSDYHKIINMFNVNKYETINILNDSLEIINLKTKNAKFKLKKIDEPLSKIILTGIKLAFANDLNLKISSLNKFSEKNKIKKETKITQLNLDNLLDEF